MATINVQDELNRMNPASGHVKLGDLLNDIITKHNQLVVKYNAALAKLDADAGVTDTNYASTQGATAQVLATLDARVTLG